MALPLRQRPDLRVGKLDIGCLRLIVGDEANGSAGESRVGAAIKTLPVDIEHLGRPQCLNSNGIDYSQPGMNDGCTGAIEDGFAMGIVAVSVESIVTILTED